MPCKYDVKDMAGEHTATYIKFRVDRVEKKDKKKWEEAK